MSLRDYISLPRWGRLFIEPYVVSVIFLSVDEGLSLLDVTTPFLPHNANKISLFCDDTMSPLRRILIVAVNHIKLVYMILTKIRVLLSYQRLLFL